MPADGLSRVVFVTSTMGQLQNVLQPYRDRVRSAPTLEALLEGLTFMGGDLQGYEEGKLRP